MSQRTNDALILAGKIILAIGAFCLAAWTAKWCIDHQNIPAAIIWGATVLALVLD